MRRAILTPTFWAALLVTLTGSGGAWPGAARKGTVASMHGGVQGSLGSSILAMGRSIGSPTAGHLIGGSRLPDEPYLRIVPVYAQGEVRWGLGSLVGMIDRAGQKVRKQYPDAVLGVGHLSRQGGGEVDRHRSHESGRDADIAFFVRNAQGKPVYADHFVPFRGDGTAPSWPGAFFDDARNWALVRAFVTDPQARVSHIFVATPLRARLLAYAQKIGAPTDIRDRAALVMVQPHGSLPHDDHFHVRISCPPWQRECVELPVRKKPALVARVPRPMTRARTGMHLATAEKSHEHGTAPHATQPESAPAPAPAAAAAKAANPEKAEPVMPPPGNLVVPQSPAQNSSPVEAPSDREPIDDVDGPM